MRRSLVPFILVTFGFVINLWASVMPLFDWQISEIVQDFPPTYEVHVQPSPWMAMFGDSLDDKLYVFRRVYVSENKRGCFSKDLDFVVKRSRNDQVLEQILLIINERSISWLLWWGWSEIVLAGIYIWWFTIFHEHSSFFDAVFATTLAGIGFGCVLLPFVQLLGPRIGVDVFASLNDCHGTLLFSAKLAKVHYETLIALFVGTLAEAGAFGIMLRQVILAVRKGFTKPVVG